MQDEQDNIMLPLNRNPDCCAACKEGQPCGSRRNPCCDSCAEGQGCSDKRYRNRNPQPPVWQEPVFPSHGQSRAAWGSNFFRNPQPPVWSEPVFPSHGEGRAAWGSNFFRNPQPPVWQEPVYPSHGQSRAAWGSNFFRNPDGYRVSIGENVHSNWPYLLAECYDGMGDPIYALVSRLQDGETIATERELEAGLRALRNVAKATTEDDIALEYEQAANDLEQFMNASRRNPQPPVWQQPVYPSHGQSRAAWGSNFFRRRNRNPQPPVWQEPVFPSHGQSRAAWGNNFFKNPQPATWSDPAFPASGQGRAAWGNNFFRNPQKRKKVGYLGPFGEYSAHDLKMEGKLWQDLQTGRKSSTQIQKQAGFSNDLEGFDLWKTWWAEYLPNWNPEDAIPDNIPPYRGLRNRNPQPPVWQEPVFPSHGQSRAAWGSNFFRKNPELPEAPTFPSSGESPAAWGAPLFKKHLKKRRKKNPSWGISTFRRKFFR